MNINRDEALRAKDLAEGLMEKSDFTAARKLAIKAQNMDSTLENISHMTMVCDVHCAAATEKMFGNDMDWYGILQIDMNADDVIIKKQYRKLALLLHPDKNKLPGAESAFKLIGEAQRILLDKEKRMFHDLRRKPAIRPSPPPYRSRRVPSCPTQEATSFNEFRPRQRAQDQLRASRRHEPAPYRSRRVPQEASANMWNVYGEFIPQQQPQFAGFTPLPTFWTSCPFCGRRYEYGREHIKREVTCQGCKKLFTAFEVSFQSVPMANSSYQSTSSFPQQSKMAYSEPHKRPDDPASAKEINKGKRKRKDMDESSESCDSESSSDSEDDETMAEGGMGSNGGEEPRRSVRSKRQVSYNESLSDDDGDLGNDIGEGSGKNVDTEKEEEEKQTHEDHHHHQSTETLPNGINPKEESLDDSEDEESSLGGEEAAEPNVINCDDPEFSDFDKLMEKSCFHERQVWALYDEEGMPRLYAVIRKVVTSPKFSVKYKWLEPDEEDETRDLPVSVGRYVVGDEGKANSSDLFSHLVRSKTRSNAKNITVFPGKGETWALFKNWDMEDSDSPREYEFVEILSDHAEGVMATVTVGFLFKVEGFKYVYSPMPKEEADTFEILPHEFFRFSHRVPSFRLKGTEGRGVLEGWYELDPAALPVTGSHNVSGEEAAAQDQDHDHQPPPSGSDC